MVLTLVGVSHRTGPVEIRELLAFRAAEYAGVIGELRHRLGEADGVVVSTCNRTELYVTGCQPDPAATIGELLCERLGADAGPYLYTRRDRDAVSHLFAVAAGLESMVFGEAQIQGQVKDALEHCRAVAGPVLPRLFHAALRCATRVRAETGIARGAGSVSSAAVRLAKNTLGPLAGRRAMVLGAGDVAELALECLTGEGVRVGVVANRTYARAEELARRYNARAMHYDECWTELAEADVLVCSTAAPRAVVHRDHVLPALAKRGGRALCILDIALPRDVSPDVGDLENVFLYDLDDLQAAALCVHERRREDLPAADAIIASETDRFWQWWAGLQAVPVLTSVRAEVERLRQAELAAAERRYGPLTREQRETLDRFSRSLMNKFLHAPSIRLREAAGSGPDIGVVDAARYLFGVEEVIPLRPQGADALDESTGAEPVDATSPQEIRNS